MGGKSGQTIGYHYFFSLLWGLCRGPINELVEIVAGEKSAWKGSASDNSMKAIVKPNLFGGEKKEGGVQGPFRIFPGRFDQVLPGAGSIFVGGGKPYGGSRTLPNVKTTIGGLISEFRGTTMLWFDGLISSMNPYPKEWKFRIRRYNAGWYNDEPWYPLMARVLMAGGAIHAMNPAHILYQCLTDPSWGRGLDPALINENSFILGANTLCDEGFGLCLFWQRKDDIDVFINQVQEHIAAELYPDPETGLMTLKLLRNDYDPDDLPVFTPSTGLLDIEEDDSSSQDNTFNEVIGKGQDPITNKEFQLRVHNLAARLSQGSSNPQAVDYPGIPTRDLLLRVLQRDLKLHASGLKRFNISLDRRGWRIRQGMCFRVQHPQRELGNIVLRAVEITDNAFRKGRIEIRAMQDVFGMPATSFVTPVESTWTPPDFDPVPADEALLLEANYRDLILRVSPSELVGKEDSGAIGVVAVSPNPVMYEYELATKAEGETEFVVRSSGSFTGAATLTDAIGPYDTTFEITGATDFPDEIAGQVILCGDEQMGVSAWDQTTGTIIVERGVADTIPTSHAAATTVFTLDDDASSDGREYIIGETASAKVLTRSVGGLLDETAAPTLTTEIVGRWYMPYPPGDVRVDGDPALALSDTYPEPELTWTHRDRVTQADEIIGHTETSFGPEAGVTYTIRVYDATAPTVAIRTEALIAGTSWQYDAAMQTADGDPSVVYFELEAARDGLASFQHYRFLVYLSAGFDSDSLTWDSTDLTFDAG